MSHVALGPTVRVHKMRESLPVPALSGTNINIAYRGPGEKPESVILLKDLAINLL